MTSRVLKLLGVFLFSAFIACSSEPLLSAVTERQSITLLAFLSEAGIPASRVRDDATKLYQVVVPAEFSQQAAALLARSDILEDRTFKIEQLLERKTFVPPTPDETLMRRNFLIALQLERILQELPGIRSVRVSFPLASTENYRRQALSSPFISIRYLTKHWNDESLREKVIHTVRVAIGPEQSAVDSDQLSLDPELLLTAEEESTSGKNPVLVSLPFPFSFQVVASELPRIRMQIYALTAGAILSSLIVGVYIGTAWAVRRFRQGITAESRARKGTSGAGRFSEVHTQNGVNE